MGSCRSHCPKAKSKHARTRYGQAGQNAEKPTSWPTLFISRQLNCHRLTVEGVASRKLGKKVQTELAAANAVADEALGNIATVRAHAAEDSVKAGYSGKLHDFYVLQVR